MQIIIQLTGLMVGRLAALTGFCGVFIVGLRLKRAALRKRKVSALFQKLFYCFALASCIRRLLATLGVFRLRRHRPLQ